MKRFDVAAWRVFDGQDLPIVEDGVEAASAFEALERVLWHAGWPGAAHVHVVALDGSINYQGERVVFAAGAVRDRCVEDLVHLQVMQAWEEVHQPGQRARKVVPMEPAGVITLGL